MDARGFSLIEATVALAVSSLGIVAVMSVMNTASHLQGNSALTSCMKSVRSFLVANLNRDEAWKNTLADAYNKAGPFSGFPTCINTASCPNTSANFRVLNASLTSPNPVYNGPTPAWYGNPGFTQQCQPCTGAPSVSCPIQLKLTYNIKAAGGAVSISGYYGPPVEPAGQIEVVGQFLLYDPAHAAGSTAVGGIYTNPYEFHLMRFVPQP